MGVDPLWYYQSKEEEEVEQQHGNGAILDRGWQRGQIDGLIKGNLGKDAIDRLKQLKQIERDVASLVHVSTSGDGTTKLLLQLSDGLQVETVIIPWSDRQKSTLCIS
jgi:adenine C2-methylase RlmN of 23S rRNA A2503 and tRNA A37